jgi:hypothetical protein
VGPNTSGIPGGVQVERGQIANPKSLRISEGVAQGLVIVQNPPVYPPMARMAKVQGPVVLEVVIDK